MRKVRFPFCVLAILTRKGCAVLDPLKVTITNYEGEETLETALHPLKPELGTRKVAFSSVVYIDRADFAQVPPPKYQRLKPDGYVRLKNAYIIHCDEVITDAEGNVTELKCSYIPESRSSNDTSGIKVKGTIQWVDGKTGVDAEKIVDFYIKKKNFVSKVDVQAIKATCKAIA